MKREFFVNIVILIFINLLIKPFYIFGIDLTIQNSVPSTEYGMYFTLLSFTWIFQIINDFGIQSYNNRTISQTPDLLPAFLPNILGVKLVLGGIYFALVFGVALLLGYSTEWYELLAILAFNWVLNSLLLYLRSNISALGFYRIDSFLSVLDKLLMILICGYLLWVYPGKAHFQMIWLALAQTVAFGSTALVAALVIYNKLSFWPKGIDVARAKNILKKSFPYAIIVALMTAYTRVDAVMIERLLPDGDIQTDIYASAYRLLDAANMFGYLFAGLLLPMFSKLFKQKQAVNPLVRLSFGLIFSGATAVATAIWFYQYEIMTFLYTDGSVYSGQILGWLMISFVAVTGAYVYGTLLVAQGNVHKLNVVFLLGLLLNIALNWVLIPEYKALGAAIATVGTQFFVFLGQIYVAYKEVGLKRDISMLTRLLLFCGASIFVAFMLEVWADLHWQVLLVLSVFSTLLLAVVFGLLNKELIDIIKNKE